MQQEKLISELISLERKLNLLLTEFKSNKEAHLQLENENSELKSLVKLKDQQLNDFQNKIKISSIVNNVAADNDQATELKKQLNSYIKNIDKCIAQLSE